MLVSHALHTELNMPLILIGIGAGILAGLFGVGGGVIIVPGLIFLLGMSPQRAAGTSLAAMLLPVGALGVWIHEWEAGHVVNVPQPPSRCETSTRATRRLGAAVGADCDIP